MTSRIMNYSAMEVVGVKDRHIAIHPSEAKIMDLTKAVAKDLDLKTLDWKKITLATTEKCQTNHICRSGRQV